MEEWSIHFSLLDVDPDTIQYIVVSSINISENETEGIIRARADIDGMNVVKESMN